METPSPTPTRTPPRPSAQRYRQFRIAALFFCVLLAGMFVYQHFTSVYHFATVNPGLVYRDGARSVGELNRVVSRVHPKTVVCLVDDRELTDPDKPQFQQEIDSLRDQGIALERIPISLGGWPTSIEIQRFLKIASDPARLPVLVHCAQGVRRTGMMVAAYQMSIMGDNKARAKDLILDFGHSDKTIDDIRRFIDEYDPDTRTTHLEAAPAAVTPASTVSATTETSTTGPTATAP